MPARDGIYGVDCPPGDDAKCLVNGKLQAQSCTICGLSSAERNMCEPTPQDDGVGNPNACGVSATNATDGTVSIVPALTSCKMNMVPEFVRVNGVVPYSVGTGQPRHIVENPGQETYDGNLGLTEYSYPTFRAYRGDDVMFAMTAVDRDDCTELDIEATALPEGAVMEPPEYLDDYPEFPEGRMVRRVFKWAAPQFDEDPDERPEASMVCFYATDKYLLTVKPFYCVEILIEEQPSDMEQTLLRFDCKLSLDWNPLLRRFVVTDAPWDGPTEKFYTKCEFEDFMWHHAMVTVSPDGDAQLYVDGEQQEMIITVGKDPEIVTQFGRGTDVGTSFRISAYPNQCPLDYVPPPAPARHLLEDEVAAPPSSAPKDPLHVKPESRRRLLDGHGDMEDEEDIDGDLTTSYVAGGNTSLLLGRFQENFLSDQPVVDGFLGEESDPAFNDTSLGCCSFTVANGCSADMITSMGGGAESRHFAGLTDEVAVWNRALTMQEVRETMFKMPQYLPTHKLEAPRGVQMDLAAGRVLYTRFNNPCMEGSLVGTPAARRRMQQTGVQSTGMGSPVWIGGVDFNQPRREVISDESGFTSGNFIDAEGYLRVRDRDNDTVTFIGWREHAGYAYTGVPWAAPIVHGVDMDDPVPLDGGVEIVVKGIGFARSPFLKCATVQPDVRGEYLLSDEYEPRARVDSPEYVNRFLNVDGSFLTHSNPWMYDSFSQVQLTRGRTKFSPDDAAPELHPSSYRDERNKVYNPYCPDSPCEGKRSPRVNCRDPLNCPELNPTDPQLESRCVTCSVGTRIDWLPTNDITSNGRLYPYERISPLPALVGENYALDYYFGSWETVTCQAPPAAFPSDIYYIGVSNDAGITGSPPNAITYTEYALHMEASGSVLIPEVPGKSFSAWFLIESEAPACNEGSTQACRSTIFRLTNGVGVSLDYGVVVAKAGMRTLGDTASEQFLGSLGSNLTSLGEWHHAMLTINDTTVSFYLDGVDVIEEEIEGEPPAEGYKLLSFGDNLIGYVDEVKVFKDVLTFDEYKEAMWRREPTESDRLEAYYRLNNWDDPFEDIVGGHGGVCTDGGVCELKSIAAPWEPTTLYSINGDSRAMETRSVTGGEVLDILGFNFAPSQWLGCQWGTGDEEDGFSLPPPEEDGPVCPPIPTPEFLYRPDTEGRMGRPDGLRPALEPYGLTHIDDAAIFVPEAGLVNVNNTVTMRCITPELNRSGLFHFAAANYETLVPTAFEFVEVALECDGVDDYMGVPQAAAMLANTSAMAVGAYTIGMWVQPYSQVGDGSLPWYEQGQDTQLYSPHVPGDPDNEGPVRQSLHDPDNYIGVVASFESPTPVNGPGQRTTYGSIVYNGEGFYYYDDCIADVKTSAPAVSSQPNMWHYVAVAIDEDGCGTLYVDGNAADHFTTSCRIPVDASFSMCASVVENPGADGNLTQFTAAIRPNSHFAGRVDEVEMYQGALEWDDLEAAMFRPEPAGEPKIKFDFSRGCSAVDQSCDGGLIENIVPGATGGDGSPVGGTLVQSTGPWAGAEVLSASRSEVMVGGGEPVTVNGHNFAPSQWLKLDLGYGPSDDFTYVNPTTVTATTPEGICHDEVPPKVTNADGIPDEDGSSMWSLEYECTTESLLTGLVAFYNMDDIKSEDGMTELMDSVGDASGSCKTEYAQADRNGFQRAAFGSLEPPSMDMHDDCSVPAPASYLTGSDYTVAAWVFLPYFPGMGPGMTALGGWKLVTYTMDDMEAMVYVGHQPAREADSEYLKTVMENFVSSGTLAPGIWDAVWVYSRALRACEVAGRYFTSSYALDFTKVPDASVNGGSKYTTVLPWGVGSVSAWVYAYNVHEAQSIVAAQDGSFVLGMEEGRVSLAFSPPPVFECMCEPCETQINYVSWKARVMPGVWHHVAVSYDGFDAFILVDGVLRDKAIIRERCYEIALFGGRRRSLLQTEADAVTPSSRGAGRKLQGVVGYGLYPDCSPDGSDPDMPVCVFSDLATQSSHEDHCLPWMLEPDAFMVGREANMDFDNDYLPPDNHKRPFNGLIYDLRSFHNTENSLEAEPFVVKAMAQCTPKDPLVGDRGDSYFKFNDGVSSSVYAYTVNGKEMEVEGITPELYRNVSIDDPTYPPATTLYGPGVMGTVNGVPGEFTITARTYCANKRVIGGDDFKLSLSDGMGIDTTAFTTIEDLNDGTYKVSYNGLPTCNTWNATLSIVEDGEETEIDMFPVDIRPAATDPTTTEAMIAAADGWNQCSNSLNYFLIQARDFNGCPQRGFPNGTSQDKFVVTVRGPADLEAAVTYSGDGIHNVSFVPPAAGTYFVEVALMTPEGPVIISNGQQCITVCAHGSMFFSGGGHVEVQEEATADGIHYLDGAGLEAFTMEAWVNRLDGPATADSFILIKGTYEEGTNNEFVKGYSLQFTPDGTRLVAAVYTGLGDHRTVEGPNRIAKETWHHVAAVYNGTTFRLYVNGENIGTSTFPTSRPLHANPYYHPVSVGPGFYGGVDEVKIHSRALSQPEISGNMFCPPPMDMDDVLLYLSFNSWYDSGSFTQGYSEWCTPHSPQALSLSCLQAAVIQQTIGNVTLTSGAVWSADTDMDKGDGVGIISKEYSHLLPYDDTTTTDEHPTLFTVAARDMCGYAFINGTDVSPQLCPFGVAIPCQSFTSHRYPPALAHHLLRCSPCSCASLPGLFPDLTYVIPTVPSHHLQGLFSVSMEKYSWTYFSPNPPNPSYPRLDISRAQEAPTTVMPDTCFDPYNPTTPYYKGDVHNQKFDFALVRLLALIPHRHWPTHGRRACPHAPFPMPRSFPPPSGAALT